MKGKRRNQSCPFSASLAYTCLIYSILVVARNDPLLSVSATTISSAASTKRVVPPSFIRWRAGAFGSSNRDDPTANTEDDCDSNEAERKGKKEKDYNRYNIGNNNSNDAKVEEYVAAMKERDAGQDQVDNIPESDADSNPSGESSNKSSSSSSVTIHNKDSSSKGNKGAENAESSVVGVKSHKKSNGVGDPDGSDDDDDDDDTDDDLDSLSEFSEEWEEIEETYDQFANDVFEPQVEVKVELVEEEEILDEEQEVDSGSSRSGSIAAKGGGGVGVRLGRIANRRKNSRRKSSPAKPSYDQARLLIV
ncbi:unnamed protein product [Pseudo-nitzschia multistriata]|uniref:Uncharacterized protein n=1 Tax=Pseudo-nitzschia multistriata TaxID=183589 RepID=A0A448ZHA7_9STRA|nr:unnamed protein product [Pseudo-nitzschia multistriata]